MKNTWLFSSAIAFIILMASCRSVPPSVIGTDTRAGLETLSGQVTEIASQAASIDLGVDTVAKDLEGLALTAPDALREDIRVIQSKVTMIAGLTEAHKGATAGAVKATGEVKDGFEDDMKKVAVQGVEKARAEVKAERAKGQRNVAWVIMAGIGVAGGVAIWLKFRSGILGVMKKLI